jgi:lipopolysaccharide heptosyltransferase II
MSKRRILIVKIGALGDVLMTTPAVRFLSEKEGGAEIFFLVGEWSAPVLRHNGDIDELITVDDRIFTQKKIFALANLARRLAKLKFDRIYIFQRNIFYYIYFSFLNVPLIGFRKQPLRFLPFFGRDGFKDGIHHIYNYLEIAGAGPEVSPAMRFSVLKEINLPYEAKQITGMSSKIVIINPGGGTNPGESVTVRQWPAENYIRLIEKIGTLAKPPLVCICGGKDDFGVCKAIDKGVAESAREMSVVNLCGTMTLQEFRKFIDFAECFITGDAGGMHIAAAAGRPVLSIFGPTDPQEKAPLNDGSEFVAAEVSCSPCYHKKFPGCDNPVCMEAVTVDNVFSVLKKMI